MLLLYNAALAHGERVALGSDECAAAADVDVLVSDDAAERHAVLHHGILKEDAVFDLAPLADLDAREEDAPLYVAIDLAAVCDQRIDTARVLRFVRRCLAILFSEYGPLGSQELGANCGV